jgi:hypothetical protein
MSENVPEKVFRDLCCFKIVYQSKHDTSCHLERPCVRFCCENKKLCNQKYINDNFDANLLPDDDDIGWKATKGIKAYFGKPECILDEVDSEDDWEFETVNNARKSFK